MFFEKDCNIKLPKPWGKQKNCDECMYKLGMIKTLVCPCPQCLVGKKKILKESKVREHKDD